MFNMWSLISHIKNIAKFELNAEFIHVRTLKIPLAYYFFFFVIFVNIYAQKHDAWLKKCNAHYNYFQK